MRFSDISGLDELKASLIAGAKRGSVAHAQLFLGRPGSANLALALAYATYLNCTDDDPADACGQCPSCQRFAKLEHPDLTFVYPVATTQKVKKAKDAVSTAFLPEWREFVAQNPYASLSDWSAHIGADNKQCSISKEESRNVVRALALKAFEAKFKIMLVWQPELMHPAASNAILKILEEPSGNTVFLLVANDANKLLSTITSRTQLVNVRPFDERETKANLVERFRLPEAKAAQVAPMAEGDLAAALRLANEVADGSAERFRDWMRACFKKAYDELAARADSFQELPKEEQKSLLRYGLSMFREAAAFRFAGEELLRLEDETAAFVKNFSKVVNERNLPRLAELFTEATYHLERNANPRIVFLDLSIRVAKAFSK